MTTPKSSIPSWKMILQAPSLSILYSSLPISKTLQFCQMDSSPRLKELSQPLTTQLGSWPFHQIPVLSRAGKFSGSSGIMMVITCFWSTMYLVEAQIHFLQSHSMYSASVFHLQLGHWTNIPEGLLEYQDKHHLKVPSTYQMLFYLQMPPPMNTSGLPSPIMETFVPSP